jgi:hypothetical protein
MARRLAAIVAADVVGYSRLMAVGIPQTAAIPGKLSEPLGPLEGPLRAVFRLSRPTFSEATEPRPFWYGCWKLDNSMSWRTPEGERV